MSCMVGEEGECSVKDLWKCSHLNGGPQQQVRDPSHHLSKLLGGQADGHHTLAFDRSSIAWEWNAEVQSDKTSVIQTPTGKHQHQ